MKVCEFKWRDHLTRTIVVEVFNAVALKYWTVDRFSHWFDKKTVVVLVGDDPGGRGICTLFCPHFGAS